MCVPLKFYGRASDHFCKGFPFKSLRLIIFLNRTWTNWSVSANLAQRSNYFKTSTLAKKYSTPSFKFKIESIFGDDTFHQFLANMFKWFFLPLSNISYEPPGEIIGWLVIIHKASFSRRYSRFLRFFPWYSHIHFQVSAPTSRKPV